MGPQGIFKPAVLPDMPLTITTVPIIEGKPRPYEDEIGYDGLLQYRYRGTDPLHPDNAGLRRAMGRRTPLVYLYGVVPGEYLPVWPVYVVRDDPSRLVFSVAVDLPAEVTHSTLDEVAEADIGRRQYVTRITQQRLHQISFRIRVLRAYGQKCAVCRLRHSELLDAAHILPDGHPKGEPVVRNGLALCKLHHAAFDGYMLAVRPDLLIQIRPDILHEEDGPMLKHGLQGFEGVRILVPRVRSLHPDPEFLAERYDLFRRVG